MYVSPTPQGPGKRAEEGTKRPKYSVFTPQPELASSSTPASLPLPTYCFGLVILLVHVCVQHLRHLSSVDFYLPWPGHSFIYHSQPGSITYISVLLPQLCQLPTQSTVLLARIKPSRSCAYPIHSIRPILMPFPKYQ